MSNVTEKMNEIINELEPGMVEMFKYLHKNPELSTQEFETTKFIKKTLSGYGIEIIDLGMETGVAGLLKGAKADGPCIALRADIDALPVQETTDLSYKSENENVMHACGHDAHMAALLGAAQTLSKMKDDIKGSVKFLFQPAEEQNIGAKMMIQNGIMKNPKIDAIFGLHNQPEIPLGTVGIKKGGLMAAVDKFFITVKGKGGHGGVPHRNNDPIVATAGIISSLQHIVSRKVNPKDACVISVCSMHAGSGMTFNIIPDEVKLAGTVRSYDEELNGEIEDWMRNIITNVAAAHECSAELEYIYFVPAIINPDNMYPIALKSAECVKTSVGSLECIDPIPSTGGEDFTYFMQDAPGFFYWLGVGNPEIDAVHPWHSPNYKLDERAVALGASLYASSVFNAIEAFENNEL